MSLDNSMAIICPTVLASDAHEFRQQMEKLKDLGHRVQIDLTDGLFARNKTITLEQVWWMAGMSADLHLMYERPDLYLRPAIELSPNMIILHAEAQGNFFVMADMLKQAKIKVGVALLPRTSVKTIEPVIDELDHVLIFSGNLGHFGGHVELDLLEKVRRIKEIDDTIEIGWDGGVDDRTATKLVEGGVDVLNVGGFIQKSEDPKLAYDTLVKIAEGRQ
jgi:ribulose-phosphate 3-epimerase